MLGSEFVCTVWVSREEAWTEIGSRWQAERHQTAFSRDFVLMALRAPLKILGQLLIPSEQEKAAK